MDVPNFRRLLNHISDELHSSDVEKIANIYGLNDHSTSLTVLRTLEKRGVISHKQPELLVKLLEDISRYDIINTYDIRNAAAPAPGNPSSGAQPDPTVSLPPPSTLTHLLASIPASKPEPICSLPPLSASPEKIVKEVLANPKLRAEVIHQLHQGPNSPFLQYHTLFSMEYESSNSLVPTKIEPSSGRSLVQTAQPHELIRHTVTSATMPDPHNCTDSDEAPPPPPPLPGKRFASASYVQLSSDSTPPQTHFQQVINHQERTQTPLKEPVKLQALTSSITTNTSHFLPESYPEFINPMEVIHCDSSGGIYHNPLHGITLCIPEEAILQGEHLEISIGVCLYGDCSFISGLSPVSAIVWLCSNTHTTLLKPVKVIIPHFLDCKSKEEAKSLEMQFMKARHRNSASKFVPADGEADFVSISYKGILHTHCFCYLCICAGISPDQLKRRRFCIVCAIPRSITTGSNVYFYVLYFLDTCIQSVEAHLDERYSLHRPSTRVFRFSDVSDSVAAITGEYHCSAAQKLITVTLQPTRISQDRIDFWQLHQNGELALMEKMKVYPPCMLMTFGDLSSCEEQVVTVLFRGTQEPVEQMKIEIIVPSGKGTPINTKSLPVQARPVLALKDTPTLCQLWLLRTEEMTPVRILRTLAPRWEELGTAVNFDPQGKHVQLIKKECGIEGSEACCKRVLMDWLCGKGDYQPPTWENMLKILEDMEEENLMITICKLLS